MRVLISTALGRGPGGATSHIESLAQSLHDLGVESSTIWPEDTSALDRACATLFSMGSRDRARRELTRVRVARHRARLLSVVRKGEFHLLHIHDALLASQIPPNFRSPMVLTVHGPISREATMAGIGGHCYLSYLRDAEQRAYESADVIISVDSGQRDIIVHDYRISAQKVSVILNAVDTDLFCPTPTSEGLAAAASGRYFLVPRRLVPKNGVEVAIRAFSILSSTSSNARGEPADDTMLFIAGDGPQRETLRDLVLRLHMEAHVHFLGSVDHGEMVKLLRGCLAAIVPSVPVAGVVEASSIAALEAMSVGKPVLASRIGGLAEMIEHGETGLLFEAGDFDALAALMRRVLEDREACNAMGAKARHQVVTSHSHRVWGSRVLRVYREALGRTKI